MPSCRMFEAFSRGYYLGRLYVEPYAGDRAVIHRDQHRRVNEQVYAAADDPGDDAGTPSAASVSPRPDGTPPVRGDGDDDPPLVMKLDGTHFTVGAATDVPLGTLALPDDLLERCEVRNPPALREVLLARAIPVRAGHPRDGVPEPRMLDRLLGRAHLKERIANLEEERDRLESQLEAESERRADAATARQAAEERVNRLEDRIADLEGQVDRRNSGEAATLEFRRVERCHRTRVEEVLARLTSVRTAAEGALTAMVGRTSDVPMTVTETLGPRSALVRRAAPCLVVADDAGLVAAALDPPRPPDPFETWDDEFRLEREWFLPTDDHAVALLRSDTFAYGEYDGVERRHFEGFESDVMDQHSKGGFSQARFERRREEQIDTHLDRVRSVLDERDPERLYLVGEGEVVGRLADRATARGTVDATGHSEAALDAAVREFWTTTVRGL